MTAEKLFDLCAGIFGESSSECAVWHNGFLGMLNGILAECMDLENGIRLAEGLEALAEPVEIKDFGEEIGFDNNLLLSCVLWGVCALLAAGDDDNVRAGYFNSKFEVGKMYALRGRWAEVDDRY